MILGTTSYWEVITYCLNFSFIIDIVNQINDSILPQPDYTVSAEEYGKVNSGRNTPYLFNCRIGYPDQHLH